MTRSILSLLEYGVMPFLLVFSTAVIKCLTKEASRVKWQEFLSVGLDLILMCAFGTFIYGISVFNHFGSNVESPALLIISTIVSFILFILAVIMALFIRNWGEGAKLSFWIPNIVGFACLIFLIYLVSLGGGLLNSEKTIKDPPTVSENNK